MVSLYSPPDTELLESSEYTLWACRYQGDRSLRVVDVTSILAVVGMVPLPHHLIAGTAFVAEKLGLDMEALCGIEEEIEEIDE